MRIENGLFPDIRSGVEDVDQIAFAEIVGSRLASEKIADNG